MKFKKRKEAEKVAHSKFGHLYPEDFIREWSVKHAENMKDCGCDICSNKRKNIGPTIQEKRMEEAYK